MTSVEKYVAHIQEAYGEILYLSVDLINVRLEGTSPSTPAGNGEVPT